MELEAMQRPMLRLWRSFGIHGFSCFALVDEALPLALTGPSRLAEPLPHSWKLM